jgi:hypothetical protein
VYDFVDRPVVRLGRGSKFVLWAMRVWTHVVAEQDRGPAMLGPAFAQFRVAAALEAFHLAMTLFQHGARAALDLSSPACPKIAEDEAVLLAIWAAATGDAWHLRGTLALLLEPEAVEAALNAVTRAARVFADAGIAIDGLSATTRTAP